MWSNILTILAILLAPVFAIQVSVYLDRRREEKYRRMYTFRTLMATRAARLSADHINALNMIDVEFYGKDRKSRMVVDAWKIYLDHLENKVLLESSLETWASKGLDLFIELLSEMAAFLNYDFDKVSIKKTSYSPEAHGQMEDDQLIIRKGLSALFSGKYAIPIKVMPIEDKDKRVAFSTMLENYLQGKTPFKVIIVKDESERRNSMPRDESSATS